MTGIDWIEILSDIHSKIDIHVPCVQHAYDGRFFHELCIERETLTCE